MKISLLPGEKVEHTLRPHPFGYLGRYALALLPVLTAVAWLMVWTGESWNTERDPAWWQVWLLLWGGPVSAYALWGISTILIAVVYSVLRIKWSLFWVTLVQVGLIIYFTESQLSGAYKLGVPLLALVASIPFCFGTELARRQHSYVITNVRILMTGGYLRRKQRQVRYETITDLDVEQGPLGRLFGYGTLIPVSASGFGLGSDAAGAAGGVVASTKVGKLQLGIGAGAGGGKSVQDARARTTAMLDCVHPLDEVQEFIQRMVHVSTQTPYLRDSLDVQRQILDALRNAEPKS